MSQREFDFEKEHGRNGLMITSAVRYCLGRRTYIVSDCCDWIVDNWNDWPDNVKAIIRYDIEEAFTRNEEWGAGGLLGDDCDKQQWEKVRKLWEEQMSGFEEWWEENRGMTFSTYKHTAEAAWQAAQKSERERTKELVYVLKEAVDCGLVPKTSASEGGASKYARQVIAADMIRAAIAKATGE